MTTKIVPGDYVVETVRVENVDGVAKGRSQAQSLLLDWCFVPISDATGARVDKGGKTVVGGDKHILRIEKRGDCFWALLKYFAGGEERHTLDEGVVELKGDDGTMNSAPGITLAMQGGLIKRRWIFTCKMR